MKKLCNYFIFTGISLYFCFMTVFGTQLLVPGGQIVGLGLQDQTVTVAAFDEKIGTAAKNAGLQVGDRLVAIDGKTVSSAEDVRNALSRSGGQTELSVLRNGTALKLQLTPEITPEGPRLGIYLKQGITGVGTVTWYDPMDGSFGALGHGVSSPDGNLIAMTQGTVYDASVVTVRTGKVGAPGQLMSTISGSNQIGTLSKNTPQGVFGTADLSGKEEMLPVAESSQIHTGSATIRSTVSGKQLQEYSVEILKIYPKADQTGRNMLIKVTDPALLKATGGIVQGMSGSPIIQDGKLVGAVTHVLVNDPTTGYGIFIENMLDAAA